MKEMTGVVQEMQIEKQMGCMAGFLQIFDRHQILTGKRLCANKRLPPSAVADSASETEKPVGYPAVVSLESEKLHSFETRSIPSPDKLKQSPSPAPEALTPVGTPTKSPLPLPVFQGTKSSMWKFGKETPRLSLDSRATVDAKGRLKPRELRTSASMPAKSGGEESESNEKDQNRSPSVIAKLMGLDRLPESDPEEVEKQPQLRRSASESRANRDLQQQYRFIDGVNFQLKQSLQSNHQQNVQSNLQSNKARDSMVKDPKEYNAVRNGRVEAAARAQQPNRGIGQRKCFYDSADFFPEPKQNVSIYGEIEKRLRMRGIDEPSKDLETLKQILEALQLKGLLHSNNKPPANQSSSRNLVYDRSFEDSPIVVMKSARSTSPMSRQTGRIGSDSPPASFRARPAPRRDSCFETLPATRYRRDSPEIERNANVRTGARGRNSSSPTRSESSAKSPIRRRPLNIETQRRIGNDSVEQRRVSPVQSPKIGSRKSGPEQTTNQSPRNRRRPTEIRRKEESKVFSPTEDESSTLSESSFSANSQSDLEVTIKQSSKAEEYKEGRHILERCDKLLHSIAEMTASAATAELQPSPVSVLDSSFYKEESSPSPVMKRNVDFKGQLTESEDDIWSPAPESSQSDDCEFTYVSDVLRASTYLPEESDVFLLLEKQQYLRGKDTSKVSRLQRRLIFDTINEIVNKKRNLPPWKAAAVITTTSSSSVNQVWTEFQRIQVKDSSEDLFEVICGVLRKDLAGDAVNGWEDCPVEMSEAVLDIERLIFKDLIGETIGDLASFGGKYSHHRHQAATATATASFLRRKLVF
ncbi:Protein LONGIFOLIA 1 [Linum perenne]